MSKLTQAEAWAEASAEAAAKAAAEAAAAAAAAATAAVKAADALDEMQRLTEIDYQGEYELWGRVTGGPGSRWPVEQIDGRIWPDGTALYVRRVKK